MTELLYWIKRIFLIVFCRKSIFCPACLGKLKDGEYAITYETLEDHVCWPNRTPPKRPYHYCSNESCVLHGTPDMKDDNLRSDKTFFDIYGHGDYCTKNERTEAWKRENTKMSCYTPVKGWLFKKGTNAVNTYQAIYDFKEGLAKTYPGLLYKSWKDAKTELIVKRTNQILGTNNATIINFGDDIFWQTYKKVEKNPKYRFLALFKMKIKAV